MYDRQSVNATKGNLVEGVGQQGQIDVQNAYASHFVPPSPSAHLHILRSLWLQQRQSRSAQFSADAHIQLIMPLNKLAALSGTTVGTFTITYGQAAG